MENLQEQLDIEKARTNALLSYNELCIAINEVPKTDVIMQIATINNVEDLNSAGRRFVEAIETFKKKIDALKG